MPGSGLGAGILLQGQQITLSPAAGQTLAISDAITDQTGSTGQIGPSAAGDPLAGSGSMRIDGLGRVVLPASEASPQDATLLGETCSGGTALAGGTLELDRHDVILAEGLPAEIYLDTGNRAGFANGAVTSLHPDSASGPAVAEPYAPTRLAGPEVEAAQATLRRTAVLPTERKRVLS